MKRLYLAYDNAMNYLIIRDFSRDDDDTAIVNWDLSDSAIDDAVLRYGKDEDDTSYYALDPWDLDYKPFSEIMENMNAFDTFY